MESSAFELSIERRIKASPEAVYEAWTTRLGEWWCPLPWKASLVALELRPGGRLAVTMHAPDGASHPLEGVILEAAPARRIVFTDAYTAGWQPARPFMTGVFEFHADGAGTRYRAAARHWNEDQCRQHEQMGFQAGWTTVAAQLAALVEPRT